MVWSRCWPASAVFSLPPRSCPRRRGQPLPGRTARSPSSAEAIYSANPDGTQRADSGKWADSPAWSPDGSQIAYSTGSTVAVMNADGSRVHRVAGRDHSGVVAGREEARVHVQQRGSLRADLHRETATARASPRSPVPEDVARPGLRTARRSRSSARGQQTAQTPISARWRRTGRASRPHEHGSVRQPPPAARLVGWGRFSSLSAAGHPLEFRAPA